MFKGSITAIITPFKDGKVDEPALEKFVDWQIREGSHGLSPCGTTGEGSALTMEEHKRVVEICVSVSNGRVPIIAGVGSNNTETSKKLSKQVRAVGADGLLLVSPYYNKPTDEGVFQHFKAVHDEGDLPVILYNIPARTGIDTSFDLLSRIKENLPNVVGIKDATAELNRVSETRLVMGEDFVQLSGDDPTALGFRALGGRGAITVAGNIAPKLCSELHEACEEGDFKKALDIHDSLLPLYWSLFLESNPMPVKFAASLLGLAEPDVRLPLVSPGKEIRALIASSIADVGLEAPELVG